MNEGVKEIKDAMLSTSGTYNKKPRYIVSIPTENLDDIKDFGDDEVLIKIMYGKQKSKKMVFVRKLSKVGETAYGTSRRRIIIPSKFATKDLEKEHGSKVDIIITSV